MNVKKFNFYPGGESKKKEEGLVGCGGGFQSLGYFVGGVPEVQNSEEHIDDVKVHDIDHKYMPEGFYDYRKG